MGTRLALATEASQTDRPLDTCQDRCYVVCRAPSILENVEAKFACAVDIGVKHLANELDAGCLVWVLLLEMQDESECAIFKGGICRANNDGVPGMMVSTWIVRLLFEGFTMS